MKNTTCDECKKDIRTGTGIAISFPYSSLQSSIPTQKPLDFCSWACLTQYAVMKLRQPLPGHNG